MIQRRFAEGPRSRPAAAARRGLANRRRNRRRTLARSPAQLRDNRGHRGNAALASAHPGGTRLAGADSARAAGRNILHTQVRPILGDRMLAAVAQARDEVADLRPGTARY